MPQFQTTGTQSPTLKVKFSPRTTYHAQKSKEKDTIAKKYCLNKPKIMKEFQNSHLFRNTFNNSQFLRTYTPRYTYNQKTKSFEKEHTQFVQSHYDVDYTSIQNLNKSNLTDFRKLVLLKRKSEKNLNQSTERSFSRFDFPDKSSSQNKSGRSLLKEKQSTHLNGSILKKLPENKLKVKHRTPVQYLITKDTPQTIKQYIQTNPMNHTHLKYDNFKGKINRIRNFKVPARRKKTEKTQSTEIAQSFFNNNKLAKSYKILEEAKQNFFDEIEQKNDGHHRYLEEEVDKLYDIIKQIKLLGYAEEKVTEWVWSYCENNKKFMESILFKAQGYKTSLAEHKIIYKLEDIDIAKYNCKKFKRTINNQQIPLQATEISDLVNHLQQILISKQYFELKRLQTQIEDTSYSIKNNYLDMQDQKAEDILKLIATFDKKKKLKPMEYYETLNFYEDAKRLETHFGKVKGLTSANKRKCENLTEIQIQIIRNKK